MFKLIADGEIKMNDKLIIPISLKSKYFKTEKLNCLIHFAKQFNATLLIADSLQRHNLNNDVQAAKKLGGKLLHKVKKNLEEAVVINSINEWQFFKDEKNLKIVHWDIWAIIKQQEIKQTQAFIVQETQRNAHFQQRIRQVASTFADRTTAHLQGVNNQKLEQLTNNSINYQQEELSYMLTFNEFDIHLYPELNESQQYLYQYYQSNYSLPKHVNFKFSVEVTNTLFAPKKNNTSLSFAGRLLLSNFQAFVNSPEIDDWEKEALIKKLNEDYASIKSKSDALLCQHQ